MSRVLFVFLDGVGLGPAGAANPLDAEGLTALERLAGRQSWTIGLRETSSPEHVVRAIDATLGVEGLPQSGTGQATLLTGVNCARVAGRHYGPFPHSKTRPTLAEHNLFRSVGQLGLAFEEPAVFANAYPPRFFQYVRKRDRWTVTTRCCLDAGIRIRRYEDLLEGRALPADLTGRGWPEPSQPLPAVPEEEAGRRLARISESHGFTLFEYFLTDKAGHAQDAERAAEILAALDRFFAGLLGTVDLDETVLLVTSDHGNLEDLSTKSHTRNPVPLFALGRGADAFAEVEDLAGVAPAILDALAEE